ncbi:MAG: cobalamin B12-binding domain-containing protein, partial [Syntrophomonadaceae bacterium]|nr:cobalamin B12-binding domain-containing protein [Syntrophomonadaceae bacterium]
MRVVLATLNASYSQTCLALYSLAAYCRGEFPDIQLLEFTINDDPGEAMAEILARQPDVLGLSC